MEWKGALIDVEGTLIDGKSGAPVPGAVEWFAEIQDKGTPYLIATNITTEPPSEIADNLSELGFSLERGSIHSPLGMLEEKADTAVLGRTLVFGLPRLKRFLVELGVEVVRDADADTVLFGWDPSIDFRSLAVAVTAVADRGARLVGLHENRLFRDSSGSLFPGVGAFVRALEYATGTAAEIWGKPGRDYFLRALEKIGLPPGDVVMIGDDAPGEIAGAKRLGMGGCFVLSGQYRDTAVLARISDKEQPDLVLPDITRLRMRK